MLEEEATEGSQTARQSVVCAAAVLVTAALIWYSRTYAFAWDEGYHLVAAWLIAHGKQPYLDFVFPQTPLNAYWNSLLLRVFGEDWRVPHTTAALVTASAVALAASYIYRRLPASIAWKSAATVTVLCIFGLNTAVFEFGSLQAYAVCMVMIVSAYLAATSSVNRVGFLYPLLAGLASGAAAASSLLTAPVGAVLFVWMFIVNRAGNRIAKALVFVLGIVAAFTPLLRLLIKSPHQVIFGFLQYQLLYRKLEWDGANLHNLGEVLGWADSSQAVLLVLFAAAGVIYVRKSDYSPEFRSEIALCGWLALAQTVHLLTARPTFSRYFLLTVPFLSIAAATGLYEATRRLALRPRPWLAASVLCALTAYGLGASLFEQRDDLVWTDVEQAARKVREVTPPNAVLLADETVYFLLRRTPPTGMELEDSHKFTTMPDAEARIQHIVPRPKLDLMIKAGRFDTVEMCDDDEITRLDLASLYGKSATVGSCQVFWKFGAGPAEKEE